MPSTWITTRSTKDGGKRYRVMFRTGGHQTAPSYGGSFKTKREALIRKAAIAGDLAALRMPNLRFESASDMTTLRSEAARWQRSRVDVSEGTAQTYRVALGRLLPRLGDHALDSIDTGTFADLVGELHNTGLKKQTIRKTVSVLAMILDHAHVQPNPARDERTVRMPPRRVGISSRRPPSTSRPSCDCCRPATAFPLSFSTLPGCASANSNVLPGATSTSPAPAGASPRPYRRPGARDGSSRRHSCSSGCSLSALVTTDTPTAGCSIR